MTAKIEYVNLVCLELGGAGVAHRAQGATKEHRRNLQKGRKYPMVSRNRPPEDLRVNEESSMLIVKTSKSHTNLGAAEPRSQKTRSKVWLKAWYVLWVWCISWTELESI